jgi:hypothetical protein
MFSLTLSIDSSRIGLPPGNKYLPGTFTPIPTQYQILITELLILILR